MKMKQAITYLAISIFFGHHLAAYDPSESGDLESLNILEKAIYARDVDLALKELSEAPELFDGLGIPLISFAFRYLFNAASGFESVLRGARNPPSFYEQRENVDIAMKLLLRIADNAHREDFGALLGVPDSFVHKIEMSRVIRFLYKKNQLTYEQVSRMLDHHDRLFFQDVELDRDELIEIAVNLCDTGDLKNVLMIILKAYKNIKQQRLDYRTKVSFKHKSLAAEVASAITAADCRRFRRLHFRDIVDGAIERRNIPDFKSRMIVNNHDSLSGFVLFHFLRMRNRTDRLSSYRFWQEVADHLWKERNGQSAFTITSTLASLEFQQIVKKKILKNLISWTPGKTIKTIANTAKLDAASSSQRSASSGRI